jgi:hypothetical protein
LGSHTITVLAIALDMGQGFADHASEGIHCENVTVCLCAKDLIHVNSCEHHNQKDFYSFDKISIASQHMGKKVLMLNSCGPHN